MSSTATLTQRKAFGEIRDYVLLDEIGRGAHGVVYRARARGPSSDVVALKVIEDTSSLDKLLIEPQILSKLHHRNIVGLRDYFLHAGKLVLVTEYIDGPDLAQYLELRGRLSPADVRRFLEQMCDAVAHAHSAGVFHSDLKPSNILVDTSGDLPRYVIADFGVSRMANAIQRVKYVAGTCAFMAPEQFRGRGGVQSDLWALGTIAYTMIAGAPPFPARTLDELRRQILYEQPLFPPLLSREDAPLERAIVRLLEKSVVDRTPSAAALRAELVGENGASDSVPRVPLAAAVPWEEALTAEVKRRRKRTAIWILVASLPDVIPELLGCAGAWLVFRGQTARRVLITLGGVATLLSVLLVASLVADAQDALFFPGASDTLTAVGVLFGLAGLGAASNFVELRRAERELTLVRSLRLSGRDESVRVLRDYVTASPGDLSIRRRYMEALVAAGLLVEAAAEAKLALDVDPYNFQVTLVLANAYFELGLYERCEQVCNGYLEIAGQCFEFEDLLTAAKRRRS